MIRALILYYLNIKKTHGYEIQRFVQFSGIDRWTKIQSGSIYYALGKLEKEQKIRIAAEEGRGLRSRKIYEITEQGREALHMEMAKELGEPITSIGSTKFIIDPILATLKKEEIQTIVSNHIEQLKSKLKYWEEWKQVKGTTDSHPLNQLSFDITIRSLKDQILWHEEVLNNLDYYITQSGTMKQFIQSFDADRYERVDDMLTKEDSIEFAKKLKETIRTNPEMTIRDLEHLIEEWKKQ